ncbi:MAG TPA: oligosaccharide flippase family protein [Longimicrobiales bacterium]|nr:oligosaccharide flippase family protein [Longimicrobiales bacterium]
MGPGNRPPTGSAPGAHERRHLLDGAAWGLLGEGLALPTGLVTVVLLTRVLGASDYGLYTLTVGFVLLIQTGIGALLSRATIKFISESEDPDAVSNTALRLHVLVGAALAVAVAATAPALASVLGEESLVTFLRLFALSLPIQAAADAHVHVLVGRGKYRRRALARAAYWVARPILVVGPVLAGYGVPGALAGAIAAPVAGLVVARRVVRPRLAGPAVPMAPLLGFAAPLLVSGIAADLSRRLDLFALKALGSSAAEAGLYASAQNLAWIPAMLAGAFSPLLLSSMTRAMAEQRPDRARQLAVDFLRGPLWILPLAGATAGAATQIVRFTYGAEYEAAGAYLALLIFAGVSVTLSAAAGVTLVVRNRLRIHVIGAILPLLVSCGAFAFLIPRFGGVGAAASTLMGVMAGAGYRLFAVHRLWEVTLPWPTVLRVMVLVPPAWWAGGWGPTQGVALVLKLTLISCGVVGALMVLGEFSREELQGARRALAARLSRRGTG